MTETLFQQVVDSAGDDDEDKVLRLLMKIAPAVDKIASAQKETRELLENHMRGEDQLIKLFREAFPGGDTEGHRQYHEALIEQARERKEFWKKLSFELAKWGLIGFLGWLIIQAWHGALKGPT